MNIDQTGAHIDQMLRQTRVHHVQLSMMADQKASLLLTVCAIIVPLTARFLNDKDFHYVALTLICFSVLTMFLAIYTAMPSIRKAKKVVVTSPSFNCLFFGDFSDLDYNEYVKIMEQVISDPASVYEVQIREIYLLGQYLTKHKYRYLRLSYLSFLAGVLASVLVFILTRL